MELFCCLSMLPFDISRRVARWWIRPGGGPCGSEPWIASSWMLVGGARNTFTAQWRPCEASGELFCCLSIYISKRTSLGECGLGPRRARRITNLWIVPAPVAPGEASGFALLLPFDISRRAARWWIRPGGGPCGSEPRIGSACLARRGATTSETDY